MDKNNYSSKASHPDIEHYQDTQLLNVLKRQQKVLVVDDESTGRSILTKIIQQAEDDILVEAFGDPLEALTWLDKNQPDLIITDYRMPSINGVELIKAIRQKDHCQVIPIMMITVVSEKSVRYEALEAGATAFLTRPIDQIECRTSCRNLLKLQGQQSIIQDTADSINGQVAAATQSIIEREKETLVLLAKAGEYRDKDTGSHVVRMAKYAREIASALGFSESECDEIEYAAPLHDIGKIGTPDKVLLKPGRFEPDEREIMQQHTTIGHSILSDNHSPYIEAGSIIALNHHERFDGTGYPAGISGSDIPLVARIVSVADVYDALVSPRSYKKAWSNADAQNYLKEQSGKQFDPICIDAFFERIEKIQAIQRAFNDSDDAANI